MMKASEFRVDNWVNDVGSMPYQLRALQIVELSQCEQAKRIHLNINPIPLTEEWLLKFGFEKGVKNIGRFEHIKVYYSKENDGWWFEIGNNDFHYATIIYFVHQLQNIHHSLTGQELSVKELQSQG